MEFGFNTLTDLKVFLPFISLVLSIVTVIVGLDIIWRVEHDLDKFIKWLTLAVGLSVAIKLLSLLGLSEALNWVSILLFFDLAIAVSVLAAFLKLYKMVRLLDNEKKKS